jgi:hypothetical protein
MHDVPIAEIEAQQVGVCRVIQRPGVAPRARGPPDRGLPGCDAAAASAPVPDGCNRYAAYQSVLFIENADSGQPKGDVNGGLRVHSVIFPLATDIYAWLFTVDGPQFCVPGAGLEPARPFGQTLLRRRCLPVPSSRHDLQHGFKQARTNLPQTRMRSIYLITVRSWA